MKKSSTKIDAGKISYLSGGRGENLLLLHSLNLSADSWNRVFEPLSRNYTVYALDMLGHGDSDKPPKNYLIEDYAQSVIASMDQLKMDKSIVCGNSVGALIALEMAASYPKRVKNLILVGCPARDPWERMERLALSALGFDVQGNPQPLSMADLAMSFAHPNAELLNWFNRERAKAGLWVKKTMIAISLYDVFPKLRLVKCPTLILFGDKDILRDREKTLLQGIKGAKHALIEDAGHVPQVEKPESFLREVSRFLSPS
jgi:pimeloyl-ACP methyl ester carboxylesterase